MTDLYPRHSQFTRLHDPGQRWFSSRAIFVITVITIPLIIFCSIYLIVRNVDEQIHYPKTNFEVPYLWKYRAKAYSSQKEMNAFLPIPKLKTINIIEDFKVVCYYNFPNNDSSSLQPEKVDPFMCTHINVAFGTIKNLTISLKTSEIAIVKRLVQLKNINPKLKVLLCVGGAGEDTGYASMVLNHTNRKTFIRSTLELVKLYSIDGIDLDWEFPTQNPSPDPQQRMHFTQLLEEFRATIDRQTKYKFLLTVAVAAPVIIIDSSYDISYLNQFVDFINVMSYDYHFYSKITPFTGFNSPLYASESERLYLSTLNINYTAHYWNAAGVQREKIIIGLPTYGHTFRLMNMNNNGLYAPARGVGSLGSEGFADYTQICQFLTLNHITPAFDSNTKSPYAYKATEWLSFENEYSLSLKAEFIRDHQFGGAMIYSLNADDHMGVCSLDPKVQKQTFPLTRKVSEILGRNYSIF